MKNNNPKGIIFILLAMLAFSVQDSIMKYIYNFASLYEVYLIRTLVSFAIIVLFLKITKKPIVFKTKYPLLTFCRVILFFFGFSFFYISLTVLPLITATALFFVTPFLITIFAKFFLKEQIGPRRWSAVILGFVGAGLGIILIRRVHLGAKDPSHRFSQVERIFVVLQILTACAIAFAHGSNDVANAIGPLAAVAYAVQGLDLGGKAPVEPWMLAIGGIGIVIGLATWGYRVMETVGKRITELTPSRGFAAQLAAATTIVLASRLGIPISTTHTLVGAVLGVGLARGISALDLRVVGKIIASWVATLPIAAGLSIFFYFFFKGLLTP